MDELENASRETQRKAEHRGHGGVGVIQFALTVRFHGFLGGKQIEERSWRTLRLGEKLEFLSVSDPVRAGESSREVFFLAKPQRTQRKIEMKCAIVERPTRRSVQLRAAARPELLPDSRVIQFATEIEEVLGVL